MIRGSRGSTLIYGIAAFLATVLILGFIAMNYQQLFGFQKQAQTAVDAATIAVSKEIQKVTVLDPRLGRIGVIDQYGSGGLQQRPIYSINTVAATVRLDSLIAQSLGSTTMLAISQQDMTEVRNAATKLSDSMVTYIGGGNAQDVDGKSISGASLKTIAANAYNTNNRRSSKRYNDLTPADFIVEVGDLRATLGSQGVTNIPCPNPDNLDGLGGNISYFATVNGQRYYRAKVQIPSPAGDMILSNLSDQIRLVDKGLFDAYGRNGAVIPSVVKLTAKERVIAVAPQRNLGEPSGIVTSVACAQMGGPRILATSGVMRIEFPQGMPPVGSPAPFTNNSVTVRDILVASQVANFSQAGNPAPWAGNGGYFTANGGAFPGSGSVTQGNYLGRNQDNPSVSLAFFVYDWLRNEGLKPNIASVDRALRNTDLRNAAFGQTIALNNVKDFLVQPVLAQRPAVGDSNNVYGAIFKMSPGTNTLTPGTDPRSLVNATAANQQVYVDQAYTFRMQSSVPQQLAWAQQSKTLATGMDDDGNTITVDGNPVDDLYDLERELIKTKSISNQTDENAIKVLNKYRPLLAQAQETLRQAQARLTQALADTNNDEENSQVQEARQAVATAQVEVDRLQVIVDRATNASNNGKKGVRIADTITNNLLAVTAIGCKKVAASNFTLARNLPFFPPNTAASEAAIEGSDPVPTGQVAAASGSKNWVANNIYIAQGTVPPSLNISKLDVHSILQPAFAQSVVPSSQTRNFRMLIQGDSSKGSGQVLISIANTGPSASSNPQSILRGQLNFQALNTYAEPPTSTNPCTIYWSVMSRNNAYSTQADVRKPPKAGDPESEGNVLDCSRAAGQTNPDGSSKACDCEVMQWQFTSPLPDCPPPPIPPDPPPGESH
jgi:hypothetical protein